MKQTAQALTLAVLLAYASAQSTTVVNNPSDTGVVYSYYSICPTETTTTITLDTTTTICPGPKCGGAMTTYKPNLYTTVGPDGRTTVAEVYSYTAPCPCDGGICDAVYTVTRDCPCTAPHPATDIPAGFTTAAVACNACAAKGGPSTVTVITPASNGPYASQTPVMGTPYNGAYASAAANAYASAGPNGAVASAGASAGANTGAGVDSGSADARASNSTSGSSSNANANANANAGNNLPGSNSTGIVPPITPYHGSADRAVFAVSAIFAGILGSMAFLL